MEQFFLLFVHGNMVTRTRLNVTLWYLAYFVYSLFCFVLFSVRSHSVFLISSVASGIHVSFIQ